MSEPQPCPVIVQQHCSLIDYGVEILYLSSDRVNVSNKYVCVREGSALYGRLLIVDVNNSDTLNTISPAIVCESAAINPSGKLIALKTADDIILPNRNAGKYIRIYNTEMKMVVKWCLLKTEDDIKYYIWISTTAVGLIGETSVYHWDVEGDAGPLKVFDVHSSLKGSRVVDYKTDASFKWSIIIAVPANDYNCINGRMQLYSVERQCSQLIEGHAACFTTLKIPNSPDIRNLFLFVNKSSADSGLKLHFIEIGRPSTGSADLIKKSVDVFTPDECSKNFPVALVATARHNLLYLLTAYGYLHLFDIETSSCVYISRITDEIIIATAGRTTADGVYCADKIGRVLSIRLDQSNVIPYLVNVLKNDDLAVKLATRDISLNGSEDIFMERFNKLYKNGHYSEAVRLAVEAPNGILRKENILRLFENASGDEQYSLLTSPLLQYFGILLDRGYRLNAHESFEICKRVLNRGKKELIEKWLRDDKIHCSKELGDMVNKFDSTLALSVYLRANVPDKVIECFLELRQFEKIVLYCKKIDYKPDIINVVEKALMTTEDPEQVVKLAKALIEGKDENVTREIDGIVRAFSSRELIKPCTAFLLDVLKENKPIHGSLQTKLIEINILSGAVQVADAIIGNNMFSYYDRRYIGQICEKAGLFQRALEHYTEIYDIKRIIVDTARLNEDWVVDYFSNLSADDAMDCLKAMLSLDIRQNLQVAIKICVKYYEHLTIDAVMELFENFKCYDGLYYFLGSIIHTINNEHIHFKYIQSASKTGRIKELERICKESNHYDPEKVKNYLKDSKLSDQLPLIIVCDRFDYVRDLVFFLYHNNLQRYIEIYLRKINESRTPEVIGLLLDIDCNEEYVRNLIMTLRNGHFSTEKLVEEVEKRNRLNLLLVWLESRINEGFTDTATHDAVAKIFVNSGNNPERFLKENHYYNSVTIGKYCEKRDPHLACIAYERGKCDQLYLNVCFENNLFKRAARYLVKRCDTSLWNRVLKSQDYDTVMPDYHDKKSPKGVLVDQLVQTAMSETHDPDEVSTMVKAFITANMPKELMEILEKVIIDNITFRDHKNLQNLLILTAIKNDKSKVLDYVSKLDGYDYKEVATICINNMLYEEAFTIYKKFNCNTLAARVLIENIQNLDRSYEFSEYCNEPAVWSLLGRAQLRNNFIKGSIDSFIRANDTSWNKDVIEAAEKAEKWNDLVEYLHMVYKSTRESYVESQLLYAYARTDRLADLEEFISTPNNADILKVADRCFDDGMFESAKILYSNVFNYAKLSVTLANLKEFQGAVDNARKANCIKTWERVCFLCLQDKEFRLAQTCGLNIMINVDRLQYLIEYYEMNGYINELLDLMETALGLERAHTGVYTELSILYSRYKPEKMKELVELFWSRVNFGKVLRAADESHLWDVTGFLYDKYQDYDNAARNVMQHPTEAFKENHFKDLITKVSNVELYYEAIRFYIQYKPLLVNDLMMVLSTRIDHSRAISMFLETDLIYLIKPYLISIQSINDKYINKVLNDIYIEEEDYKNLKCSIDSYGNFDCIVLARKLEKHDLMEFRKISAYLFKNSRRWNESIEICKRERLYKDAINYAADSKSPNLVFDLLQWFLNENLPDHFVAALFQCYDLTSPDLVLELSWKYNIIDLAFPYFIQVLNEFVIKMDKLMSIACLTDSQQYEASDGKHNENSGFVKRQFLMLGSSSTST